MVDVGFLEREFKSAEPQLLAELRSLRKTYRIGGGPPGKPELTVGQRVADVVAATMGSWPLIIVQTTILCIWIILNVTAAFQHWDPYPFFLLNLALSFQAAYAAPFIRSLMN